MEDCSLVHVLHRHPRVPLDRPTSRPCSTKLEDLKLFRHLWHQSLLVQVNSVSLLQLKLNNNTKRFAHKTN